MSNVKKARYLLLGQGLELSNIYVCVCVFVCVCVCMCVCECNVVNATLSQRYLESTFLPCDSVVITMLSQPKPNVVTTSSQCDIVCWVDICVKPQ